MQYNFTLEEAKSLIEQAGEKVGAAFEDESMILAVSQRTIPAPTGIRRLEAYAAMQCGQPERCDAAKK